MPLCHRGIVHSDHAIVPDSVATPTTASLRGQSYAARQPIYQPQQQQLNLVYRGVAYSTGSEPVQPAAQPSEFVTQLSTQLGLSSQV